MYKGLVPSGYHFSLETFFQIPDFADLKIEVQNCQTNKNDKMFPSGVHVLQYYRKKPKCQTYKWCHYTCTHYYMFGVRHDAVWYYLCHAGNLILLPSKNINSFSSKYKSRIAYSWMWLPRWINIMMIIVGFHSNYPPSFFIRQCQNMFNVNTF